jgi:hypothetical protein
VQLWLVLLGCGAMLGLLALFGALRLELDARGMGEPSGSWAGAFGVGSSLVAVSGVFAHGLPLTLELHTLGRRFPLRRRNSKKPEKQPREPGGPLRATITAARVERWLKSAPSLDVVLRAGRRVELDELSLDAAYGFRDIALTGKVAGALYVLQGALPAKVRLTQRPSWDGSERWELSLAGQVRLYPVLVLIELLWYMLRTWLRKARSDRNARPQQPPRENPS